MRNLNMGELSEVQGGGMAFNMAVRVGELLVQALSLYEAAQKVDYDPESYGPADPNGYNPMGDFSNGTCAK